MFRRLFSLFLLSVSIISARCGEGKTPVQRVVPPAQVGPESLVESSSFMPDIDSLQASVQTEPENTLYRFQLLTALDRAGRYQEAIEEARQLGTMEKNNPYRSAALLNFASIVLDKLPQDAPDRPALLSEAKKGMEIALEEDPSSVPAHIVFGRVCLETGDHDLALHHLAIALAVTEIGYQLRIRMAEIYIQKGDLPKARAHLEKAKLLAQEAHDREALRKIASLLRRLR